MTSLCALFGQRSRLQRRAVRVKDASARPKTGSMAGGRPLGSKDAHPRSRRKETQGQKMAKKKRKAAVNKVAKIAGRNRMTEALGGGAALPRAGASAGQNTAAPGVLCKNAANVNVHGFRDNHFGRRICDIDGHYFVISRRYKCTECAKHAKQQQAQALMRAEAVGLHVQGRQRVLDGGDDDDDRRAREEEEKDNVNPFSDDSDVGNEKCTEPPYTFMGYDLRSRQLLPHGYGNDFPAFLTYRSGAKPRSCTLSDMVQC